MCEFDNLKVGQRTILNSTGDVMCNACGGVSTRAGDRDSAVYLGHDYLSRYGWCDIFKYDQPPACRSCGNTSEMWAKPCGESYSSLFDMQAAQRVAPQGAETRI